MPLNGTSEPPETLERSGLKTLDLETMKAPESRVGSTSAVVERIGEMKRNEKPRSERRAKIQGLIDGNRPKNQQKLIDKGRGDEPNFNLREGEGMVDAAKTPYYTLTFRQQRFANIATDYGDQSQRKVEWSEKISQRFHEMLKGWSGHDWNVQIRDWQMCTFGCGIPMWEDADSPFWKARKVGEVLVPDGTLADIDELSEAVIPRDISPVDLYKLVKNEKAAKTMGWFPERVKQAIIEAAPGDMKTRYGENWSEEYGSSLRRGDVSWNGKESRIPIADYLAKEFSGKITHCIVLDSGAVPTASLNDERDNVLLYKKVERFESFSQVLCPFFFDVGTGEWHSIKGLGPKIYDFCHVSNILSCNILMGASNSSKMLFQATDAVAMQETQLIDIGFANVVQPGFNIIDKKVQTDLRPALSVKNDFQNTLQSNTGQYRERVSAENQEPTLGQAQLNARNQQQLGDSAVDRHMNTMDKLYLEMVRRAVTWGRKLYAKHRARADTPPENVERPTPNVERSTGEGNLSSAEKLVLRFYRYCVEIDQVPEEALEFEAICSVNAVRGVGNGSPVSTELATRGVLELVPMMDERGRRNALRMRTAFLVGQGNVDSFFPPFDEQQVPDDHAALATLENNALRTGGKVLITPRQDHLIHFEYHYEDVAGEVKALKAGQADPFQTLEYLHTAGPHLTAHMNAVMGDPTRKDAIKWMQENLQMLGKVADQLQQQIEEHLKSEAANPPEPQVDPKLAAAMAKVQGELQIKREAAMGKMQLAAEQWEFKKQIKDLQTAHQLKLSNIKTQDEIARANATSAAPATAAVS